MHTECVWHNQGHHAVMHMFAWRRCLESNAQSVLVKLWFNLAPYLGSCNEWQWNVCAAGISITGHWVDLMGHAEENSIVLLILHQLHWCVYLQRCHITFQRRHKYTSVVLIQMSSVRQMLYSTGNLMTLCLRYVVALIFVTVGLQKCRFCAQKWPKMLSLSSCHYKQEMRIICTQNLVHCWSEHIRKQHICW